MNVQAKRFDVHGRDIETVEITVSRVNQQVYLYIKGKGPAKHYSIPLEQWRALETATKNGDEK